MLPVCAASAAVIGFYPEHRTRRLRCASLACPFAAFVSGNDKVKAVAAMADGYGMHHPPYDLSGG